MVWVPTPAGRRCCCVKLLVARDVSATSLKRRFVMSRFSTTLLPVRPKTKNRTPAFNRPFAFDDFRSDLENMFQRFWTGWMPFTKDYGNYNWDFDTTEYEKEYVVKAELPGFEENEIDVQF